MKRILVAAGVALAAILPAGGASAAPQILGLVATAEATPLTCENGVCSAEFSAFCLQQYREEPEPGTPYAVVDPGMIELLLTLPDGTRVRQPAGDIVAIASARTHLAVDISVPQAVVEAAGASEVALVVGDDATALPLPTAGDSDPLVESEIAVAAGPLREIAGDLIAELRSFSVAAAITNRLINALADETGGDMETRAALWAGAVGAWYAEDSDAPGVARAANFYRICQDAEGYGSTMERCLQMAHDRFMGRLNIDYWKTVGAGS